MEPVAAFINYAVKKSSPAEIVMTGISGGGWTTQLYSALDDRIKYSFPVAGSYPFFLRSKPDKSWGIIMTLGILNSHGRRCTG
jgi:cephalosporin-C deacetylase-like acetyl esterase